jgi:competence protein ComEC
VFWVLAAVAGTLATTLVETIATSPFGTYHFQNVNPFGLIGNALTLPLVSLVIMPAAVAGVIAHPFGLDQPVWWVMGLAVRAMLGVSGWISGFDSSTVIVPAFGAGALALLAAALVLLTLLASPLRWLGLAPAALGLGLAATPTRHDLVVDRDGAGAVVRGTSGRLVVLGRPSAFVIEQWLKADGDKRRPNDEGLRDGARCDRLACVVVAQNGAVVSFIRDRRAFAEDCGRAGIVISGLRAPGSCRAGRVIDRAFLDAHGATALRLTAGLETATVRQPNEAKPWTRPPPSTTAPRKTNPRDGPAPAAKPPSFERAALEIDDAAAPSSDEPG